MATYWGTNYWHPNYWSPNYWADVEVVEAGYWHPDYWNPNYWASNYWAFADESGIIVEQQSTPNLSLSAQVTSVVITANIRPATAALSLAPLAHGVANNVTVSQTATPHRKLTPISPSSDAGEYYEGDINYVVFVSSGFSFTDTVEATTGSLSLTPINPAVTAFTGDVAVQVTSTPPLTLTALNHGAANPVVVRPLTPSLTLESYDVTTGFGTLVVASTATRSLNAPLPNVIGTRADINEFEATLATLSLSAFNPTVIGRSPDQEIDVGGSTFDEYGKLKELMEARKRTRRQLVQLAQLAVTTIENERR